MRRIVPIALILMLLVALLLPSAVSAEGVDEEPLNTVENAYSGPFDHPVGSMLAQLFDVDYEAVMEWFEAGYGFGDIMLALVTEIVLGDDATSWEDLLVRSSDPGGWGAVWEELGLIGASDQEPDEALDEPPAVSQIEDAGPPEDVGRPSDAGRQEGVPPAVPAVEPPAGPAVEPPAPPVEPPEPPVQPDQAVEPPVVEPPVVEPPVVEPPVVEPPVVVPPAVIAPPEEVPPVEPPTPPEPPVVEPPEPVAPPVEIPPVPAGPPTEPSGGRP